MTNPPYVEYPGDLSPQQCRAIISLRDEDAWGQGTVGGSDEALGVDPEIRQVRQQFFPPHNWVSSLLWAYALRANEQGWGAELSTAEATQLCRYGQGDHYAWHPDAWGQPYGADQRPEWAGLVRKISVVALLSPPQEYEGGDMRLEAVHGKAEACPGPHSVSRHQGTVVVFPSHVWHQVTHIVAGCRYSATLWCLGPPWR